MFNDGFNGTNMLGIAGLLGAEAVQYRDYFYSLPEDVQEQVNAHADEFHSVEEMQRFVDMLDKKS